MADWHAVWGLCLLRIGPEVGQTMTVSSNQLMSEEVQHHPFPLKGTFGRMFAVTVKLPAETVKRLWGAQKALLVMFGRR